MSDSALEPLAPEPRPAPQQGPGFPAAAERIRAASGRLGDQALEAALRVDPGLRERLGEDGLRLFLRDTQVILDRIARAVAAADVRETGEWAEWVAPVYRRRRVSMDDVVTLLEGVRAALGSVLGPEEQATADAAVVEAVAVFRWHRRLGGDTRKRNRLLAAIYRGG